MRGWIIKDYTIKGNFWGYRGARKTRSKDIRRGYIYRSKKMAERVANSHNKGVEYKIVEVEINEVKNEDT